MKIIKFGGKSLANGEGLEKAISILLKKLKQKETIVVACSARGNTTDELEKLLEKAVNSEAYKEDLEAFKSSQVYPLPSVDYSKEFTLIADILKGVKLVGDYSARTKDLILAQGELLSIKMVSELLNKAGANTLAVDSRQFLVTDDSFGAAKINEKESARRVKQFFKTIPVNNIPIVSGFIAATPGGDTTTLGRNGSNYSASLLAQYLSAQTVESFTHVNGIYTTNPDWVNDARPIKQLNYFEASELASFGANVLHHKTISPLVDQSIVLKIRNTFNPDTEGTVINNESGEHTVKSIAIQNDVALINLEGRELLGKSGIDGRIFHTLERTAINIGVISQGSSERGVSFIIKKDKVQLAVSALKEEFRTEIKENIISKIYAIKDIAVATVIGQDLNGFSKAYTSLIDNDVNILLINNTLSGNNISLILKQEDIQKAVNLIHAQIFGVNKNINIAIVGKGTVGRVLIDQINAAKLRLIEKRATQLNVFAIAGRDGCLLNSQGIAEGWSDQYQSNLTIGNPTDLILKYASEHHLENLVLIDNTASSEFVQSYPEFVTAGFDVISSNKIANTIDFEFYGSFRDLLKKKNKVYLYETNVGAGLPLIDTIKLLHDSGENITRIKGVFSGSLSYIFNRFSNEDVPFSEILQAAISEGYTEPDAREDLSGNDVARKLLVLARELDLENEFEDIRVQNLLPEDLSTLSQEAFNNSLSALDNHFQKLKDELEQGEVLRFVGELHGDLQKQKGELDVRLEKTALLSPLGQLTGSDSLFEIYTESYGSKPIIIQGAGAGAAVTARGVFGDLLRIAEKK